jgi:hypothetical protein
MEVNGAVVGELVYFVCVYEEGLSQQAFFFLSDIIFISWDACRLLLD